MDSLQPYILSLLVAAAAERAPTPQKPPVTAKPIEVAAIDFSTFKPDAALL